MFPLATACVFLTKLSDIECTLFLDDMILFFRHINDDVPFSCCTPHVLRPCINHHVHNNDVHYNYDYRVNTTLYNKGCTDKLMEFYEDTLLSNGGAIILGLSFVQVYGSVLTSNRYNIVCPPVRGDNSQALASGLSHVQVDKHAITPSLNCLRREAFFKFDASQKMSFPQRKKSISLYWHDRMRPLRQEVRIWNFEEKKSGKKS